jgi:hypothetical protein
MMQENPSATSFGRAAYDFSGTPLFHVFSRIRQRPAHYLYSNASWQRTQAPLTSRSDGDHILHVAQCPKMVGRRPLCQRYEAQASGSTTTTFDSVYLCIAPVDPPRASGSWSSCCRHTPTGISVRNGLAITDRCAMGMGRACECRAALLLWLCARSGHK